MSSSHGIPRARSNAPRDEQLRLREQAKIKEYNAIVSSVQELRTANDFTPSALAATSTLLTTNPEFYSIWNYRRQILCHLFSLSTSSISTLITTDLDFLIPLLLRYPKCYWVWNHRSFLLSQTTKLLTREESLVYWQKELGLVGKMFSRDARNFHGWGYRRRVIAEIQELSGVSMVEEEFAFTTAMYEKNMSNYSAWHNRTKLIPRLLEERKATVEERRQFFDDELETLKEALYTDPFDQSLHLYHHWLVNTVCNPEEESSTITLPLSTRQQILRDTISWMNELLEDEAECTLLLEELVSFVTTLTALNALDFKAQTSEEEADSMGVKGWLSTLIRIDPMRKGHWQEFSADKASTIVV